MALSESELEFRDVGGRRFAYRLSDGRQVCGAKVRSKPGSLCGNFQHLSPNGRCRNHGGLGGRPPTTGRWAKSLGRFGESYMAAKEDPELLDLSRTLAILDMVVERAARRIEEHDTPAFRRRLQQLYEEMTTLLREGEASRAQDAMAELGRLIRDGGSEEDAFGELSRAAERLSRRAEKAWDLKLTRKHAIAADDLAQILGQFLDFVRLEGTEEIAVAVEQRMLAAMSRPPRRSRVGMG
ncbi:MAG: hypothetical protein KC766_16940 [Myxococcales bacterium]|nr:hypothetical protein [Myxococcales bacterium]MCB9609456.1 hypothetical protein [Polyangiaceae bacterium]